jgi:muramoyltetrapeptide carboxypeptidase
VSKAKKLPVPLLAPGETVGVVATGFGVRRASLAAGVGRLRRMGYRVLLGEHVHELDGYFAGQDEARAEDLRRMVEHPDVRAIWFARGGYGTSRILDRVPWEGLERRPKLLVGYSDLTALFSAVIQQVGQLCLYGPVVAELGQAGSYHAASLKRLLAGQPVELRLRPRQVLAAGRTQGRLLGGNLTVLAHLCGTPYAPDLRGAVLFLEDVGEEAYRVDRMLTQLRSAGMFEGLAGVLVGQLSVPRTRREFPPDRAVEEILRENFLPCGVPVVIDLPAGHIPGKRTLPLGGWVELDTAARTLRLSP